MAAIEYPVYGRTYKTYPSCFQIAEKPLYALNEFLNQTAQDDKPGFNPVEFLKQRQWTRLANVLDFAPIRYTGIAIAMIAVLVGILAAYTLTSAFAVGATIFTIPLDIGAGLAEAVHAYSLNYSKSEILRVLQKKCIAYPAQQLTFALTFVALGGAMTALIIAHAGGWKTLGAIIRYWSVYSLLDRLQIASVLLIGNTLTCYSAHRISQAAIAHRYFPAFFKPDDSNIFINGGSVNEFGEKFADIPFSDEDPFYTTYKERAAYRKQKAAEEQWRKSDESARQKAEAAGQRTTSGSNDKVTEIIETWEKDFKDTQTKLSQIEFAENHVHPKFLDFYRIAMEKNVKREQLLGIDAKNYSKESILQAYKRWSLILHPDRQQGPKDVADKLFTILCEARLSLENEYGIRLKKLFSKEFNRKAS